MTKTHNTIHGVTTTNITRPSTPPTIIRYPGSPDTPNRHPDTKLRLLVTDPAVRILRPQYTTVPNSLNTNLISSNNPPPLNISPADVYLNSLDNITNNGGRRKTKKRKTKKRKTKKRKTKKRKSLKKVNKRNKRRTGGRKLRNINPGSIPE